VNNADLCVLHQYIFVKEYTLLYFSTSTRKRPKQADDPTDATRSATHPPPRKRAHVPFPSIRLERRYSRVEVRGSKCSPSSLGRTFFRNGAMMMITSRWSLRKLPSRILPTTTSPRPVPVQIFRTSLDESIPRTRRYRWRSRRTETRPSFEKCQMWNGMCRLDRALHWS